MVDLGQKGIARIACELVRLMRATVADGPFDFPVPAPGRIDAVEMSEGHVVGAEAVYFGLGEGIIRIAFLFRHRAALKSSMRQDNTNRRTCRFFQPLLPGR